MSKATLLADRTAHQVAASSAAFSGLVSLVDGVMLLGASALAHELGVGIWYAVLAFLLLACTGLQRPRINLRLGDLLPALLGRMSAAFTMVALPAVLGLGSWQTVGSLARVALVGMVLVPAGRVLSYATIRGLRERGRIVEPTLIIGAGAIGAKLAAILREHREYGMAPIGFLDSFDGTGLAMPILGDVHALVPTVERNRVTRIIVAFGAMKAAEMIRILRDCDRLPVEVFVVPRFFELGVAPRGSLAEEVWGIPLIHLRRPALRRPARVTKRIFDLTLATLALVLTAPLLLAAAVAVGWTSQGPILFRQKRIGRNGQLFELLKLRTLYVNDDSDTMWSVAEEDRLTPVGPILRRTGIDELPQLINVLRGEMSLIGPRPERTHFVNRFSVEVPRYNDRHRVPGGITGWAQVHGLRGDTPIDDRSRFDNHYIEHWSLWHDIVILVRTIAQLPRLH
jgi:exopolysaccharide biosynthesis polyprenyl glycosylphosphotransferase